MQIFRDIDSLSAERIKTRWFDLLSHIGAVHGALKKFGNRDKATCFDAGIHAFMSGLLYLHVFDQAPEEIAYRVGIVMECLSNRLVLDKKVIINFTISTEEFRENGESHGKNIT